jgi:hypothetical protein
MEYNTTKHVYYREKGQWYSLTAAKYEEFCNAGFKQNNTALLNKLGKKVKRPGKGETRKPI